MHPLIGLLGAAGVVAYPFLEARWFRIKHLNIPLGRGAPPIRILHVSDTHLTSRDRGLIRFLQSLPGRSGIPDLIVVTGDLIDDNSGITPITQALNNLESKLGRFYVLGSHDYYQTRFQSFLKYFGETDRSVGAQRADTATLEANLQRDGWICLTNTTHRITTPRGAIRLSGVDDPYLDRHRVEHIARSHDDALAVALVHAPEVVSDWMLNGFDLVCSGHTHGGQVRIPGIGALVTNSSLPSALAGGLHRIGSSWLHVSPGLGTGKFSPIRFNCRPEVTLLELAP